MRVVLVFGQAQQGKTTLALRLLQTLARRLLVLDPVRSRPFTETVQKGDALAFHSFPSLARLFLVTAQASSARWTVVLRSSEEADYSQALKCAPYYRYVTLLVDEGLWMVSSDTCKPHLIKCARANAHFGGGIGVPLWITAQRPMDLPPDIRSQADCIISFRQVEPRDLSFLSERCSPEFAEEVADLRAHQWASYPPLNMEGFTDADRKGHPRGDHWGRNPARRISDVPPSQHHQPASRPDEVTESLAVPVGDGSTNHTNEGSE